MRITPRFSIVWWFFITGVFVLWGFTLAASAEEPSVIELESGVYYTVKKGDTLWDISNRYFNTHWRWPQIWSENQQIMNPHRIFPGERLRLYHEAWDASSALESLDQPATDQLPVIESRYYVYSFIHRIGFVTAQSIAASGQIVLFKGDKNVQKTMFGQDESIYVTPSGNTPLKVGDVYAAYRPPVPVLDPESKDSVGFQYYKTGLLRIVESREDYAVAKVEKAFRSVMVNDILLPYEPISSKIKLIPGKGGICGKIFMAEEGTKMFGDNEVAFINKGSEDGIQTGQTYAIYEEYRIGADLDFVDFGSLLVLHTEATTATVLILSSGRSIQAPGYFRSLSFPQNP
ncbi:MAG: LysM peptidoglycan-binding domain-containing protein [Deltaproteobacteria bacterium]|nr:LysM peptidoglycan-binding domain-containing protein [Deltaproteobacteria bacterium]